MTAHFQGGSLHGHSMPIDHEPFILAFPRPLPLFGHVWEVYARSEEEFGRIDGLNVAPERTNVFAFQGVHMAQRRAA